MLHVVRLSFLKSIYHNDLQNDFFIEFISCLETASIKKNTLLNIKLFHVIQILMFVFRT